MLQRGAPARNNLAKNQSFACQSSWRGRWRRLPSVELQYQAFAPCVGWRRTRHPTYPVQHRRLLGREELGYRQRLAGYPAADPGYPGAAARSQWGIAQLAHRGRDFDERRH